MEALFHRRTFKDNDSAIKSGSDQVIFRVPHMRAASAGSESKLSYTPQNTMDYGTLLCSASNTVGEQREPCVFHIIMAGWCLLYTSTSIFFFFLSHIHIYWIQSHSFLAIHWKVCRDSRLIYGIQFQIPCDSKKTFLILYHFWWKRWMFGRCFIRKMIGLHFFCTLCQYVLCLTTRH